MAPSKKLFWQVLLAVAAFQALSVFAFWALHQSLLAAFAVNSVTAFVIRLGDQRMQAITPPGFVQLELVVIYLPALIALMLMAPQGINLYRLLAFAPFVIGSVVFKEATRPIRRKKG